VIEQVELRRGPGLEQVDNALRGRLEVRLVAARGVAEQ
jgi:hypothetical protein